MCASAWSAFYVGNACVCRACICHWAHILLFVHTALSLFGRLPEFAIEPSEHVYACLVSMLSNLASKPGPGRAERRDKIYELLARMQETVFEISANTMAVLREWFQRLVWTFLAGWRMHMDDMNDQTIMTHPSTLPNDCSRSYSLFVLPSPFAGDWHTGKCTVDQQ